MDTKWSGGLSGKEAGERLSRYGKNEIARKDRFVGLKILLSQFKSPLVYVLLFAAIVTFFLHEYVDTGVILLAVVVNTILGFVQEYRAEKSLEALKSVLAPKALVLRDGEKVEIPASELVPGDVVFLNDSSRVPADGVLIEEAKMFTNEAILTGESELVEKFDFEQLGEFGSLEAMVEKFEEISGKYVVFMGTTIKSGTGMMLVLRTGHTTAVGQIADSLKEAEQGVTPLQSKVVRLSKQLAILVGAVSTLVLIIGVLTGDELREIFPTAVALAVSAIPEGLAVSLTVVLAIGVQRMLSRKAVVRKLSAAETLGSVDVICADKTGTLTEGVMRVTAAYSSLSSAKVSANLIKGALLGNEMRDPLEIGMSEWARKHLSKIKEKVRGVDELRDKYARVDILPFDPDQRYLASLHKWGTSQRLLVAGAPEILLGMSKLSAKEVAAWERKIVEMGSKGFRMVGFAQKPLPKKKKINRMDVKNLEWVGFLVYEDPVRKGVAEVISQVNRAGIQVKVITGDFRETAVAILQQIGLLGKDVSGLVLEGDQVKKMSDEQLAEAIEKTVLFARTRPEQKLRIVEALQMKGHVVAMTGDGVNDAPALKKADIGVVVNEASDVSKETAEMVLLDSNFATIVHAIEEGRGIYDNLKRIIVYLLSDAFSQIIAVVVSLVLGWPLPLLAVQILWINLISDGFPNLALTVEPREKDVLSRKPRDKGEALVDGEARWLIVLISTFAAVMTLGAFAYYWHGLGSELVKARTMAFAMLGVNSLFYVFSSRSLSVPIWRINFFQNKWLLWAVLGGFMLQVTVVYLPILQKVFQTVPLGLIEWGVIVAASGVLMMVVEGVKWAYSRN